MSLEPANSPGAVGAALQQWLQQGEALYASAMQEYHSIETQLDELEAKLVAKRAEVNQIAQIIGKPPADNGRRLSAQLVSENVVEERNGATTAHIAKALAGKFGR